MIVSIHPCSMRARRLRLAVPLEEPFRHPDLRASVEANFGAAIDRCNVDPAYACRAIQQRLRAALPMAEVLLDIALDSLLAKSDIRLEDLHMLPAIVRQFKGA